MYAFKWQNETLNKNKSFLRRKYKLQSAKRVEKKEDPEKGVRYFLELIVKDRTDNKSFFLSEYVFQPNGKNVSLCYPKGLQWNRTADVYLILTAKNLGRWVHHFIKNMEKIAEETQDEHVRAVVYDFDSPDIDLKQAFQRSSLKNYHYITKPGKYSRTVSFSEAIESIKNPNAIVVTIDMHLDIGSQFINDVRKVGMSTTLFYEKLVLFTPNRVEGLLSNNLTNYIIKVIQTWGRVVDYIRKRHQTCQIFAQIHLGTIWWDRPMSQNVFSLCQVGFNKQLFEVSCFIGFDFHFRQLWLYSVVPVESGNPRWRIQDF